MTTARRDEIIEILDCDFGVRPKAAPGIAELLPHVRSASREPGVLTVEFDEHAGIVLEAFVEAERLCCAGIGWQIERGTGLHLRITASVDQISAMESLWNRAK